MAKKVHLLVIDPQIDFCDPGGALYVRGAERDMTRLAAMLRRLKDGIDAVHVTLDSHQILHIAHPVFWRDPVGSHPDPFTVISADDVRNGRWATTRPDLRGRGLAYVEALEARGRHPLCVWPPHCLIGSPGQAVFPPLFAALAEWSEDRLAPIDFVAKGSNPLTEHYSAVAADVPDPDDPGTRTNIAFLESVNRADVVLLAGEAGSHCVADTTRDIVDHFGDDFAAKLVLLTDATSPVAGFEGFQEEFLRTMTARGMRLAETTDDLV